VWLRRNAGVPLVCVNTIHLPSVYDVLLPKAIHKNRFIVNLFQKRLIPWVERTSAQLYNEGDGLVVLSEGLKDYWRERGVTVPISVIPRSVDPNVFDQRPEWDPFPAHARKGSRLLVVCRHTREKNVERLLGLFAAHIAPAHPEATLTLVGDGPDHDAFRALAERLGVADRCHFPGEVTLTDTPAWYRHADLFVYTSQSETYGQVVSEALWCGLPVVAMADGKGVSDQVVHGSDGFLIEPALPGADEAFARAVVGLLSEPERRAQFSERAQAKARLRSDPERCVRAYEEAFSAAIEHRNRTARPKSAFARRAPLLSWTGLHLLLAVLGCLRPPAKVNRNGRRQPDWDAFDSLDVPKALPA
jgi:glycosyltransferase involved in cell wall biosynthesis